ncbi:MAG: peptidoglycan DD-metalloendopeptidase family protein [Alphaproteobacteria bacterium]|nr:peptidoglycan DD-metalloendopeptidase family protein [Alphaproteobacteria bacterium]
MRQGATATIAGAIAAVLFLVTGADATQPTKLRDVERRRAQAITEQKRATTDGRRVQTAIEELDRRLVAAAQSRAETEAAIAAAEADIQRLMIKERALAEGATKASDALEHALIALARAEHSASEEAPVAIAIAASSGREAASQARDARAAAEEARHTRQAIAEQRAMLAVAQARLDSDRAGIEGILVEQRARRATLSSIADAAATRARALAREAQNLRELVSRAVARRTSSTKASAQRAPTKGVAVSSASLARLTPAAGEVIRRYGQTIPGGTASGMTIRTRPGAQVLAPASGEIAYAGPFRGYGNVLILELDGDYAVVLTGSSSLLATAGQRVLAGQPIAEMSRDASPAPELYVEVRRGGNPVDPGRWLAAGR